MNCLHGLMQMETKIKYHHVENVEISIKCKPSIQSDALNYSLQLGKHEPIFDNLIHPGIKSFSCMMRSSRAIEFNFDQGYTHERNKFFIVELNSDECYFLKIDHKVKIYITEIFIPHENTCAYLFKTISLPLNEKRAA